MSRNYRAVIAVVVLTLLAAPAWAGVYYYMPPGQRMQAEEWQTLPAGSPVADPLAAGGKAVLLKRGGDAMATTMDFKCSYYALSVWVRAVQENTYLPPAYLELTVGDRTWRVRLRYNCDRNAYLPGYNTNFVLDKTSGYEVKDNFARAKNYIPNPNGPNEWWGENTRIYFPIDVAGKYTVKLKLGDRSQVDLLIDRLELRDVLAHLPAGPTKKQRVLFSDDEANAWARLREHDPRAEAVVAAMQKRYALAVKRTDEQMWDAVPPPNMPRSQRGGPCPVHGEEVYRRGGQANPWRGNVLPYHVTCLVGDEVYPSNAYEKGDMTSGDYPDDGWGYFFDKSKSASPEDHEMWWVGRRVYTNWQGLTRGLNDLAEAYLVTGDPKLAHVAGVQLAAVAYHYPGYDYRYQSRQTLCGYGRGGWVGNDTADPAGTPVVQYNGWACGKIFYCGWTGGPHAEQFMIRAYDLLFPALMKDEKLLQFVGSKVPWVKTFDDLQTLFDQRLLAVHADALIRRQAKSANSGWEGSAALMGAIEGGPMAARILHELSTRAHLDGTDAGGFEDAIVNMLNRDGVGLIYSPMYMFGWTQGLRACTELLARIPDDELRARYGLTGPKVMSRIAGMCGFARDIRLAGQFLPNVGDTERAAAHSSDHFLADVWPLWLSEWRKNRDPRYAALVMHYAKADDLLLKYAGDMADLEADAKKVGGDLQAPSRTMGGYGGAVLESGYGQPDLAKKAAVFLPFGPGWGHAHADTLNIEVFSHGYRLLPDMGRHHGGSTYHNVVMVDGAEQSSWADGTRFGWINHFAAAPGISFVDLGARPRNYDEVDRYRRAVAMVDVPGGNQYVFDVFQVAGGNRHDLGLHGPPACGFTCSEKLSAADDATKAFYKGRFRNEQQGVAPIAGPVVLDWRFLFGPPGREPKETDVHIRATVWGAEGGKILAADVTSDMRWDVKDIHLERTGKDLASNFVTLMDPYEKQPFIKTMQRVPVQGKDAAEAAALEVVMNDGRRDLIAYNGAPGGRDTQLARLPLDDLDVAGGMQLRGVLGFVSRDNLNGPPTQALLVGGTRLSTAGLTVEAATPEYRVYVKQVDYGTGEITLAAPLPAGMNLAGQTVVIGSPERSRAYRIVSLSGDGLRLRVEGSLLLFQSRIETVDPVTGAIKVEFPFYQGRADPLFYNGCVATNETHSAFWRVKEVTRTEQQQWYQADRATLAPMTATGAGGFAAPLQLSRAMFTDANGDGRDLILIYEIAPGDTVRLSTYVHVQRGADGKLVVQANVPYRVK